jgi:hypothetical protein
VEQSEWKVDRQWRSRLSRDISEAIEELAEHPENAAATLRILNSRLRPLGIRLEMIDPREPLSFADLPD